MPSSPDPYMPPPENVPSYSQQNGYPGNPIGSNPYESGGYQSNPAGSNPYESGGYQSNPVGSNPYEPGNYQGNPIGSNPYEPGGYQSNPVGAVPYNPPPPPPDGQFGSNENITQNTKKEKNPRAQRALIFGFISVGLSLFSAFRVSGYTALIFSICTIVAGIQGLQVAKRLPKHTGRALSIIGIVLGSLALALTLLILIAGTSSD